MEEFYPAKQKRSKSIEPYDKRRKREKTHTCMLINESDKLRRTTFFSSPGKSSYKHQTLNFIHSWKADRFLFLIKVKGLTLKACQGLTSEGSNNIGSSLALQTGQIGCLESHVSAHSK